MAARHAGADSDVIARGEVQHGGIGGAPEGAVPEGRPARHRYACASGGLVEHRVAAGVVDLDAVGGRDGTSRAAKAWGRRRASRDRRHGDGGHGVTAGVMPPGAAPASGAGAAIELEASYRYPLASTVVPPPVLTAISTSPAEAPAGVIAVIRVSESTVNEVAGTPANVTAVEPVKPVPVMVTFVPPPVVPRAGASAEIVGAVIAVPVIRNFGK